MPTIAVTDDTFASAVIENPGTVLLDFWAEWCPPCKVLSPILAQLSEELSLSLVIAKMNVDESPLTPARFGVRSIPTLIIFKNGALLGQKVGMATKPVLRNWIADVCGAQNDG